MRHLLNPRALKLASCLVLLISTSSLQGCNDNPLGDSKIDSEFNPGTTSDIIPPSAPSGLSISGVTTLVASPTFTWTASTDNTAVTSYEVAIGTTSGGEDILSFTSIGDVTTYQVSGISPSLSPTSNYFFSVRAKDAAGNPSDNAISSSWTPALTQTTSAYHYPDNTYAQHCLGYLNSGYYNSEGDGLYWIDPDGTGGNSQIQAHCDMTRNGGGWTLVINRRGGADNTETCGANLNAFFQATCGIVTSIGYADSYSIGDTSLRENIISSGEFMFLDFDNFAVLDSDDTFIIHHNTDLFQNSLGTLNRYTVTQVCDVSNTNCDSTGVEFLWVGNGFFSSSLCNGPLSLATYFGNYGYCHNGSGGYNSNSLFGDRDRYDETKLWIYTPQAGDFYQQQIFIR